MGAPAKHANGFHDLGSFAFADFLSCTALPDTVHLEGLTKCRSEFLISEV